MISICQIRAGRALLGWSAQDLADKSGVGVASIRRYELQEEDIPSANLKKITAIKKAFESEGIEFIGDPSDNPGVILHKKGKQ